MYREITENKEVQNKYITVEQAKDLCIEAHKGQWRRPKPSTYTFKTQMYEDFTNEYGNKMTFSFDEFWLEQEPYSTHPIAVAEMMNTDEEKIVAYLHDVFEDCSEKGYRTNQQGSKYYIETPDKIYPVKEDIYYSLNCLTKIKGEKYEEYLGHVASRSLNVKVKIADMFHNMSDNPSERQKTKYTRGLKLLLGAL